MKLCRGSHWEFCFISTRTALEQTCKSAVMSTVCVVVVVGEGANSGILSGGGKEGGGKR